MPYKSYEKVKSYNREYARKRNLIRKEQGICNQCGKTVAVTSKWFCSSCLLKFNKHNREYTRKMKIDAISHYGGKCVCCGESTLAFLSIDHINNDGKVHRLKMGRKDWGGKVLYIWLRKNNYPEGFRVLCFNCNLGRSVNGGICPHEEMKISQVLTL